MQDLYPWDNNVSSVSCDHLEVVSVSDQVSNQALLQQIKNLISSSDSGKLHVCMCMCMCMCMYVHVMVLHVMVLHVIHNL